MPVLTIDAKDFLKGESTAEWNPDRGFSPSSYGLNLTKQKGLLYFSDVPTSRGGATLTGNPIAFCVDPLTNGNDAYIVDDEGAFYTYEGTTLTKRQTGSQTYELGSSDLIPFAGNFYATSKSTVAEFNNDIGTLTENWWTGLDTTFRHPLEVVENELFIADKNIVYFWNGTSSGVAVTLPTTVNVTSLRKHPDGRTLLAFTGGTADFSHTRNTQAKVYYIDPNIRDWTREVPISAQVEGSRVVGGIIFVSYGKNVGYFDGNGLQFLKELSTSTTTYSQSMTNIEDILVVRDGVNVRAYGDLGSGRVWWNITQAGSGTAINCPFYKGDNVLLMGNVSGAAGVLEELDMDSAGTNGVFYGNRILFAQESRIKRIEVIHLKNSSQLTYSLNDRDRDDTVNQVYDFTTSATGINYLRTETDIKTEVFQLVLDPSTGAVGIIQFRVWYEPIER